MTLITVYDQLDQTFTNVFREGSQLVLTSMKGAIIPSIAIMVPPPSPNTKENHSAEHYA